MKKPSRFLRMILASGLLISLLAVTIAPAAAQPFPEPPNFPYDFQKGPVAFQGTGQNAVFYPWVANGDDFGLGDSQTSISVQNLEAIDGQIWIYRGTGNNTWTLAATATLSAWASKTFTGAQLGIAEGSGAPVAVVGYTHAYVEGNGVPWYGSAGTYNETVVLLSNPIDDAGEEGQAQVFACVANNAGGNPSPFIWTGDTSILDSNSINWIYGEDGNVWVIGPWNQVDLQNLLDDANVGAGDGPLVNPFGGLNQDGDCNDSIVGTEGGFSVWGGLTIGGTAFATATAGSDDAELEQFVTTHTATSGYNAINGYEILQYDEWYLPIVQTNGGPGGAWNSIIRIANVSDQNSAVTARFFAADNAVGSLNTGFQLQGYVDGGDTWNINLSDYVPEGWIGAVHIYSDGEVFAMVDRYKVGYNMWITNTGSSANFEWEAQFGAPFLAPLSTYVLYAPHVLLDWFGWNTGINVANLVPVDNNVSIQYYNTFGNAVQGLSQRLAPHGMTYFYDPSDAGQNWSAQDPATDVNAGVVAAALIWSDYPVAAVVDATKYPETDPRQGADVFQATSYSATQNLHMWQAFPYVTKGNPTDGSGATSGINMFNPNAVARTVDVHWVNPSGFGASNFGVSTISIPAFASGFVYTLTQHNLPNGFTGSAVVISRGFDFLPIVAASANVNYDVDGDGAVIYNGFNPCGFSRVNYDAELEFDFFNLCYQLSIPVGQLGS